MFVMVRVSVTAYIVENFVFRQGTSVDLCHSRNIEKRCESNADLRHGRDKHHYLNIQNVVPPPQLLKISFFFRRRIANTINFSTPTLFFCIKLILNRNTISRNTSTTFLILNSACDKVYVCNCVFQSFASTYFGHSLSPTKPPSSPHQVLIKPYQMRSIKVSRQQ